MPWFLSRSLQHSPKGQRTYGNDCAAIVLTCQLERMEPIQKMSLDRNCGSTVGFHHFGWIVHLQSSVSIPEFARSIFLRNHQSSRRKLLTHTLLSKFHTFTYRWFDSEARTHRCSMTVYRFNTVPSHQKKIPVGYNPKDWISARQMRKYYSGLYYSKMVVIDSGTSCRLSRDRVEASSIFSNAPQYWVRANGLCRSTAGFWNQRVLGSYNFRPKYKILSDLQLGKTTVVSESLLLGNSLIMFVLVVRHRRLLSTYCRTA